MDTIFDTKLIKSYDSIGEGKDLNELTTWALFSIFTYSHAQKNIARELTHRQGKNRSIFDDDTRGLMTTSDDDIDDEEMEEKTKKLVDRFNLYLSDKHELPKSPKLSTGIISKVKSLAIILFRGNAFDILDQLDFPDYVNEYISLAFSEIKENRDSILDDWINYLINSGNSALIDTVLLNENKFWGSYGARSGQLFDTYFKSRKSEIIDCDKVYDMFRYYRREFMRVEKNIEVNVLCDIFDIKEDAYSSASRKLIKELDTLDNNNVENHDLLKEILM
jgi:hypothetical protein